MTNDEAMSIVGRMASAWPQIELTEPTVEVWREHLIDKRGPIALEVIRGLEQTVKFFPTLAEFTDAYKIAIRQELEYERNERRALQPGPDGPTRDIRDLLQSLSTKLKTIGTHNHHRGAENCPVCGPVIREETGHHIAAGDPPDGTWRDCPECVKEMAERGELV